MDTIEYTTIIAEKKRRAFATFPAPHKCAPVDGEMFYDKDAAILRLKNWSCSQEIAAVLGHGEHESVRSSGYYALAMPSHAKP